MVALVKAVVEIPPMAVADTTVVWGKFVDEVGTSNPVSSPRAAPLPANGYVRLSSTLLELSTLVLILKTMMTIRTTAMMAPAMMPITRKVPGSAALVAMWNPPAPPDGPLPPEWGGFGSGSLS